MEKFVDVANLDVLVKRMKDIPDNFDRNIRKAMQESVTEVKKNIVEEPSFPVFMGALRRSIGSKVSKEGSEVVGRIGSSLTNEEYPAVMEFGRRPGTMPPPSALLRWVELKLNPPAGQEMSIAFLVARKIKARGIEGRHFMEKGFEKSLTRIQEFMNRAADAIVQEIAHGS